MERFISPHKSSVDRNILILREKESLDSLDYESDSREPPGRVDATIVLPPWPEVKGKGAGEIAKSNGVKDFTNPSKQKRKKILSCD